MKITEQEKNELRNYPLLFRPFIYLLRVFLIIKEIPKI